MKKFGYVTAVLLVAFVTLFVAGCANAASGGSSLEASNYLDGLGYVKSDVLEKAVWEFEGGKAYNAEGKAFTYTVADNKVLTIHADDTKYTYTISADKEKLSEGKKKVGDADPVAAEVPELTRNLAGRTYNSIKESAASGSDVTLTFKNGGKFTLQRDSSDVTAKEKTFSANVETRVVTIPTSNNSDSTISYTLSEDIKTLESNQKSSHYVKDLALAE